MNDKYINFIGEWLIDYSRDIAIRELDGDGIGPDLYEVYCKVHNATIITSNIQECYRKYFQNLKKVA
jgi:hypothetical protein